LFSSKKNINRTHIKKTISKCNFSIQHLIYENSDQLHIIINSVKLTFYNFPYTIDSNEKLDNIISFPSLLDLGAMKAFALGRRAKWKDYVDMYFLFKNHFNLNDITIRANELFGKEFSSKLFRQQLCYFDDIDFSETIDFIDENVPEYVVKTFLTDVSTLQFNKDQEQAYVKGIHNSTLPFQS
jgi:hypothetical protein